jgi:hypothetical protein
MAVEDLELQDGFSQPDGTDSGDPEWDSGGPSQRHGNPDGSDGSTSQGEFRSIQQALDFFDLEFALRTRRETWRLAHRCHGGLDEASVQPPNRGRGAFHSIGGPRRVGGPGGQDAVGYQGKCLCTPTPVHWEVHSPLWQVP